MERWCSTHHIRELMDEFVVQFLRTEAASAPVGSHAAEKGVAAATPPDADLTAPSVAQVYGELYPRIGGQAYAYHAGELMQKSSRQPTIAALRAFLKEKQNGKAALQSAHPYIVLCVQDGVVARESRESSAASSSSPPQLLPAKQPPLQAAVFSAIVAAAAQSAAREIGGFVQSLTPALLTAPGAVAHQLRRPLEQQQQQFLQKLARDIASRARAPMAGAVSPDGGDTDAVAAASAGADSTLRAAHTSAAEKCTPIVFIDERWPSTIADGLALEGLLGAPVAAFSVSVDERGAAEESKADNRGGSAAPSCEELSSRFQLISQRGFAHAALLEYYAAKQKLTALVVPAAACSAEAPTVSTRNVELSAAARAAAESLAEQLVRRFREGFPHPLPSVEA
ncbi:hypothetical protein LSCM4_01872 [Leishmania orientalis]|uniref:Uncharacterized protein n=1 Tax=Leishmania orientalis TaxID=2249476 RepID=A0A836H813_9TRYP|nr:hypothetical protein LSCM4_01872 [Leishmania orientalis]